jgi:hypothetical protein
VAFKGSVSRRYPYNRETQRRRRRLTPHAPATVDDFESALVPTQSTRLHMQHCMLIQPHTLALRWWSKSGSRRLVYHKGVLQHIGQPSQIQFRCRRTSSRAAAATRSRPRRSVLLIRSSHDLQQGAAFPRPGIVSPRMSHTQAQRPTAANDSRRRWPLRARIGAAIRSHRQSRETDRPMTPRPVSRCQNGRSQTGVGFVASRAGENACGAVETATGAANSCSARDDLV